MVTMGSMVIPYERLIALGFRTTTINGVTRWMTKDGKVLTQEELKAAVTSEMKAKYGDGPVAMARPPRITERWTPRDVTDPKFANGCESVARQIEKQIGGEVKRILPKADGLQLGPHRGHSPGWYHHEVVVKDGRVYDLFTGHEGLLIAEYKKLWEYADSIHFGF